MSKTDDSDAYLLAAEMDAIVDFAIASGTVTASELMARRAHAVVDAVFEEWPDFADGYRTAVVMCGPGNNGGDGFAIARVLHERGWAVEVFFYGTPDTLPAPAKESYAQWKKIGAVRDLLTDFDVQIAWRTADLAVDALFGSGISRALPELILVFFNLDDATDIYAEPLMRNSPLFAAPRVLAVDLPSGVTPDTGEFYLQPDGGPGAASANLTVTFHKKRRAHRLAVGPVLSGKVVVKDIGLHEVEAALSTS
ncbi:MAG: NAD(P)H-hydrate epimerase [Pseudomonadota bacterium]